MSERNSAPSRRTLYENGTVLTLDNSEQSHEALVTEGSKILGLGTLDDMRSLAGRDADTVDLNNSFLAPGLIDTHPHAMHIEAFERGAVDIHDATCFDDIVKAIQARAAVTPAGEWIVCSPVGEKYYYQRRNYRDLAERRLPDRRVLDTAAPEHPVFIVAEAPRTPNVCAFNSLALNILGITKHDPDQIDDISIEKDVDTGEPTGILWGNVNLLCNTSPYWHQLSSKMPFLKTALAPEGPEDLAYWELAGIGGVQKANANGVTGLYEAHMMLPPHIEAYERIRAKELCTARVMISLELSAHMFDPFSYSDEQVLRNLDLGVSIKQTSDDNLRVNGVTACRGGPFTAAFTRMNESYTGPFGEKTRGRTFYSREFEKKYTQYCIDNDVRLNVILGGYRCNDEFLLTVDEIAKDIDLKPREWVMQHCCFTTQAHIEAFKKHGFHATSCSSFVWGKTAMMAERAGEWVLKDHIPLRRFVDGGVNLGCGSDWGPANPWEQMALAETRECAVSGDRYVKNELKLDRLQSLHTYTRNAAKVMQWTDIGELKPGNKADMIIVDRNLLNVSTVDFSKTQVMRTIFDGVGVYDTGEIKGGELNIRPSAE